jgi:hypothetical protein
MSNEKVNFRAPADLVDRVEEVAAERDLSVSAAWRTLALEGLTQLAGSGDLGHVAERALLEQIKQEEYTRQRRAWFRSNVATQLLKCWNGGLTPEEAADALHGYRREADELHGSEELAHYVDDALGIYEAAHPDNGAKLSTWIKARGADATAEIEQDLPDPGESDAADVDADPDHPTLTIEDAAKEFVEHGWEPENISPSNVENVEGSHFEVREKVRELDQEAETDA